MQICMFVTYQLFVVAVNFVSNEANILTDTLATAASLVVTIMFFFHLLFSFVSLAERRRSAPASIRSVLD